MGQTVIKEIYIFTVNLISRIKSIRYVSFAIIVVFFMDILMGTFTENIMIIGQKGNIMVFPFFQTSGYYLRVIFLGITYVYSDVPFMERQEQFYFYRLGKKRWGRRNLFYLMCSSFVITLLVILISLIKMKSWGYFSSEWGNAYKTLSLTGGVGMSFAVPYDVMQAYSPLMLATIILLLNWLVTLFVALVMYVISLYGLRGMAGIAGMFVVLLATISTWFHEAFVYFSPISWLDCSNWRVGYDTSKPDLIYIFVAIIFLDILLILICQDKVERIDWRNRDD